MKLFFPILFLLYAPAAFPQNIDTISSDISTFLNTGKEIVTAPGSFTKTDIIKTGIFLLAAAGSFYADNEIKEFAVRNKSEFNKHLFNIDRYFYVESSIALTAGTYLYGLFAGNSRIRRLGLDLGEAAFYSGAINIIIKYASGRDRPLRTDDNMIFDPFERSPSYSAFASGHTTLAFAVSTVMAEYSDNFFWRAAWFTAAGLVGAARIYHNMHWFSDVIVGGSIGYFIGSYVTGKENTSLSLTGEGISFRINF